MTKQFFLRMEGVNLDNFTHDTEDLSTIRGGGLLLLYSAKMIEDEFAQLKPISTGASSGLFSFTVEEADEAEAEKGANKIRDKVEGFLNTHEDLKHATFVVDVVNDNKGFGICKEQLIAMNRWRQMRSPSLAVPTWNDDSGIAPCDIDNVRPADGKVKTDGKVKNSLSVECRKEFGKKEKKGEFYRKQTDNLELDMTFVNDLGELTADASKGNLHHKMAVIYLDGNKFGDKQKGCDTPDKLSAFDKRIKDYRKAALTALLKKMQEGSCWKNKEDFRLETLLWGGDELIWVVPAWKGWETLQFFYEQSEKWEFSDGKDTHKLTHAGGIVFCHHNAPIYRITRMAKELAEICKKKMKKEKEDGRDSNQNIFSYQTLESFDHIAQGIDDFRKTRLPTGIDTEAYILSGDCMGKIVALMKVLQQRGFPRNKIYKVVKGLLAKPSDDGALSDKAKKEAKEKADKALQNTIDNTLAGLDSETSEAFKRLIGSLNGDKMRWLHIAELWDYIV